MSKKRKKPNPNKKKKQLLHTVCSFCITRYHMEAIDFWNPMWCKREHANLDVCCRCTGYEDYMFIAGGKVVKRK